MTEEMPKFRPYEISYCLNYHLVAETYISLS